MSGDHSANNITRDGLFDVSLLHFLAFFFPLSSDLASFSGVAAVTVE
jgi:hypothetical protein